MICPHCGNETPEGHYCGYCGARLTASANRNPARRGSAYAANPNQSVYQPDVISTFFPRLNPERTRLFGWILAGLAVVIFALGFARFVPISTVLAALLVPLLYLAYFYVVQVYEDEPRITQPSLLSVVNISENDSPPDLVNSRNVPRRESFGWSYAAGGPLSSALLCMLPPWKASGSPPDVGAAFLAAAPRKKRLAQCICHKA